MKTGNVIALASRIREKANRLIVSELAKRGISGIVPSHGDILIRLFDGQRYTMKDIAERIHRTKPTVTILVDKLVDLGYVVKEKSVEDSRVTFVALTEAGLALQPVFVEISHKLNTAVYRGLSDNQAEVLEAMLQKINNNLDI